jgi:hypothetical protein
VKFYLASGIENAENAKTLRDQLVARGHKQTYDWMVHGSLAAESPARWRATSADEVDGVTSAYVLVALLPGGRGTHVEIGAALGRGIPIVLVGAEEFEKAHDRPCIFYHHPRVTRVATPAEALIFVEGLAACGRWL